MRFSRAIRTNSFTGLESHEPRIVSLTEHLI
jgi:hypothetical protein